MRRYFSWIFFVVSLMAASVVFAQQSQQSLPNPIPVLQDISNQMIVALQKNKASMQKNPQVVFGIVRKILLPHADLQSMARSALGRDAWLKATSQQKAKFIDAFTDLMIRTYGAGLSSYTDQRVEFVPIRGGLQPGQTRVAVNSQIIRTDGPSIPVSYRLIYKDNAWKVYDFSVEGVSMIQSFRSQFAAELSSGMDLDSLTQKLIKHNARANAKNHS